MSVLSKCLRPGRAWIAVAAIAAVAPSAKADLTLTVTQTGNTDPVLGTQTMHFSPADISNFNSDSLGSHSFTFAGYTLAYSVVTQFNPASPATQTMYLEGTLTKTGTTSLNNFTFSLKGTPFTQPGSSGALLYLTSTTSTNLTAGSSFTDPLSGYASAYSTSTVSQGGVDVASSSSNTMLNSGRTSDSNVGDTSSFIRNGAEYAIATVGGELNSSNLSAGSGVHFVANAAIAMPEPASVVAGLMGLPCMGAALTFIRRRLAGAAAGTDLAA